MQKRILLALDRDQFKTFDYKVAYNKAMFFMGGNSGNAVFQYALQSMISNETPVVDIDENLFKKSECEQAYFDRINENYDCVVYSPANVVSEFAKGRDLKRTKNIFEKICIPIYAIGLGAQSDRNYSMDFLSEIKTDVYNTFKILLNHGGRIGVRGYFTGECLKKIGFSEDDFTVIGCPSLFMKGRDLRVEKRDISEAEFVPLINGFRAWNSDESGAVFEKYPKSIFVCQDEFYRLLYLPDELTWKEYQYLSDENKKFYKMYMEDRVKLYGDFPSWYSDLIKRNVSFSMGCRIHGNVVPILAGIPSFVDTFDSRVKELAEYFDIPGGYLETGISDPYELYQKVDYSAFNEGFTAKYDHFAEFMNSCGLSHNAVGKIESEAPIIPEEFKEKVVVQMEKMLISEKKLAMELAGKKIAFVAHEFGLFPNHGGVASYLYQIAKYILEHYEEVEVYILAGAYDSGCDLQAYAHFHMFPITIADYSIMSGRILKILTKIAPDYVEVADYGALCLDSLIYREEVGTELKNTKFFVNNHSASRECYEWSNEASVDRAEDGYKITYYRELAQMRLADQNIAPSAFLADYVRLNYRLDSVQVMRHPTNVEMTAKKQLEKDIGKAIDISDYSDCFVISCISRFEGRKRQRAIIDAFVAATREIGWKAVLILAGNSSVNPLTGLDYREECFQAIPDDMKERVLFYDFAGEGTKRMIYALSDLGIMASVYENFPVAMTEYVYHGVPIMVSKYNGSSDYMEDTKEYTTFDPFEASSLKQQLINFYNLGSYNWADLAAKQFQALLYMTNPKRAVYEKLNYFASFDKKEDICDMDENYYVNVTADMLDCSVARFSKKTNIYLGAQGSDIEILHQLVNDFAISINRHDSKSIYIFNSCIYSALEQVVENATNMYFMNVEPVELEGASTWLEAIVALVNKRQKGIVYIPSKRLLNTIPEFSKQMARLAEMLEPLDDEWNMESLYAKREG